ncbi:hypothetical protein OAC18_02395 [Flavobacteriaceae bacterium]|nr:hypothetical protein [Flavobacteriaceae bacterium]
MAKFKGQLSFKVTFDGLNIPSDFDKWIDDTMKTTLDQGNLIFKTQYSKGKKHGKSIQYSSYSQWIGKSGFPVDIKYWEEDEFKYGTKFDVLDGKKLNDYYKLGD